MADVFVYNNGSLLQAIKPEQNLTPLDDQPWAGQLDQLFAESSKSDGKLYGGPFGTAFGGGVLYNIPLYKKLGLEVPKTWDEFMANNEKIKADGSAAPVEQTYGETWTSQLFVLGDFHNVAAAVPELRRGLHRQQGQVRDHAGGPGRVREHPEGQGRRLLQQGLRLGQAERRDEGGGHRHRGALSAARRRGGQHRERRPGKSNDVGFFALPGNDAATNGMTVWPGTSALYIPKSVEGDKLEAAKKFIAFAATQEGCDAIAEGSPPQGPFLSKACKLPADVSQVAKDTQAYFDAGKASPALEFMSPIKGPALEQICIQVGTGQVDAQKGAELYDQDVKKQAQQLGLPGWE